MYKESILQQSCVSWLKYQYPKIPIIKIDNEGRRSKVMGAIKKREGLCPGAADIFICPDAIKYIPIFIEFKVLPNKQTDNQKAFEKRINDLNYIYHVVYSFDRFKELIETYLSNA